MADTFALGFKVLFDGALPHDEAKVVQLAGQPAGPLSELLVVDQQQLADVVPVTLHATWRGGFIAFLSIGYV